MEIEPNIQIKNLISQGNNILQSLLLEQGQLKNPLIEVTNDFLTERAGEFVSELFGTNKAKRYGKKATKAFFEKNANENRQAIVAKYEGILSGWENDVINFLRQTSITGTTFPGNSNKLVTKIRQASTNYKRPETRIKHIILELQAMQVDGLVYNSNLPQALPKPTQALDETKLLKNLEGALRFFIQHELSMVSRDWWQRLPHEIRNNAEKRKFQRESTWPWYPPTSTNLIDYLNFSDYRRIILDQSNWQDTFSKFFKSTLFIETRLSELEPVRNDIAHSRTITRRTSEKLRIYSEEILECIK